MFWKVTLLIFRKRLLWFQGRVCAASEEEMWMVFGKRWCWFWEEMVLVLGRDGVGFEVRDSAGFGGKESAFLASDGEHYNLFQSCARLC